MLKRKYIIVIGILIVIIGGSCELINLFYGYPIGRITKIEVPKPYNPRLSNKYQLPYSKLEYELKYARLTTPNRWVDHKGNLNEDGQITLNVISDKQSLLEIVREFDRLEATKPKVIKLEYEDITSYFLTMWRQNTSVSYIFIKGGPNFYFGSSSHYYKEPGQFVLRKMPEDLIKLIGINP